MVSNQQLDYVCSQHSCGPGVMSKTATTDTPEPRWRQRRESAHNIKFVQRYQAGNDRCQNQKFKNANPSVCTADHYNNIKGNLCKKANVTRCNGKKKRQVNYDDIYQKCDVDQFPFRNKCYKACVDAAQEDGFSLETGTRTCTEYSDAEKEKVDVQKARKGLIWTSSFSNDSCVLGDRDKCIKDECENNYVGLTYKGGMGGWKLVSGNWLDVKNSSYSGKCVPKT